MKCRTYTIGVFVVALLGLGLLTQGKAPTKFLKKEREARTEPGNRELPIAFEPNQGQSDPRIEFIARPSGYTLFLTRDSAVFALRHKALPDSAIARGVTWHQQENVPNKSPADFKKVTASDDERILGTRHDDDGLLVMRWVNADPLVRISGQQELAGRCNYFIGNDPAKWHRNVPTYASVEYRQIYTGVDLVYYENQDHLEYDLVVKPGSKPDQILLDLQTETGNQDSEKESLHIAENGDLVVESELGEIRLQKPIVYQPTGAYERQSADAPRIEAKYVLAGPRRIKFEIGAYDHDTLLVIDPSLVYSTYLGGNAWDKANALVVDASGNTYITGKTTSSNFPTTKGSFRTFRAAKSINPTNVFVTKLDATGSGLIYSTYLGGDVEDEGYGIAIDNQGNAYITGWTASKNFPVVAGAAQASFGGGFSDAFVTKLNASGSGLIYSTYLGGSSYDEAHAIAVDASGNAYVTGHTYSPNFPTSTGSFETVNAGLDDVFVSKLNATGSALLYSTYLGGSGYDEAAGIAVDTSGNAYITGFTNSANFPSTTGALQGGWKGGFDAFISKLNATGSHLVYSTYLGGSADDFGAGLALDSSGNAYVTGKTYSSDFPTTTGAFQTEAASSESGLDDAFVAKVNPAGTALAYSTYIGGNGDDAAFGIAVDASGNATVAGETDSTDFPTTSESLQTSIGGTDDAFLAKLNSSGSALIYSTYIGGSGDDAATNIALDAAGNVYVVGWTTSDNFPVATGAFQSKLPGLQSVFVVQVSAP